MATKSELDAIWPRGDYSYLFSLESIRRYLGVAKLDRQYSAMDDTWQWAWRYTPDGEVFTMETETSLVAATTVLKAAVDLSR